MSRKNDIVFLRALKMRLTSITSFFCERVFSSIVITARNLLPNYHSKLTRCAHDSFWAKIQIEILIGPARFLS